MRSFLVPALVPVIVLAACGDDGGGTAAAGDCPDGGDDTLDVATYVEPLGLDPLPVGGGSYGGLEVAAIYDTLVRWDPETREYEPWVAEALEPNDDLTEWTLELRDGVTFANGDPLTTEAVEASIARHQDPDNGSNLANLVAPVTEMEIVDDLTMVLHLDAPWAGFPFALANSPGMITNPAVVAERGEDFELDPSGAGVGPYDVAHYAPGEELVLAARDDYWRGPVCVPDLRFVRISGGRGTYESFREGEVDVALLRDSRVIAEAQDDGVESHGLIMNLGEILLVNHGFKESSPVTADPRIREAVAAAIDPAMVDERVNEGTGLPSSAILAPGTEFEPDVAGPAHDPDRAEDLVEEAKADGWDGRIRLACDDAPNRQEIGLSVEAQLEAVGFDVDVATPRPINDVVTQIFDADYDLACWGINVHDAGIWAKLDKQLGGDSGSNRTGYVDTEWNEALTDLRTASTDDEERAAMGVLQEHWNEAIPVVGLAAAEELIVWQDDVDGLTLTAESLLLFGDIRID